MDGMADLQAAVHSMVVVALREAAEAGLLGETDRTHTTMQEMLLTTHRTVLSLGTSSGSMLHAKMVIDLSQ